MKLTELFQKKEFVITSEVGPMKGCARNGRQAAFLKEAESLKDFVHAVNVTDNQSAVMRLGSLAASVLLKQAGIEPIYQLVCRDRNRIALQSDLLSACTLGIDNVLCLTGDHLKLGDHPTAKAVFDVDSVQLLDMARGLNQGRDMMGRDLTQSTGLALGAVVNPNFQPLDLQLLKMEKKIEAGAEFFQTQAVYDPKLFETFIRKAEGFGVPIQYGVVIIKSPKMAKYMNENVSGITVPQALIKEMAGVPETQYKDKAREITARLVKEISPMVQGLHFMPLGWPDLVPAILKS
ncbi:MAG: methylenetetrahydrofolate reductase [Syntrophales bacterium]|nr:methylenetetrahydrofolate reductase [Syntrophales bacterium]